MAEATRACRRCGTEIVGLRKDAVWCATCPKRLRAQLESRDCTECGTQFQPKRKDAVCCSRACNMRRLNQKYAAEKRGTPMTKACPACKANFLPKRSDQRYCSANCGVRARYQPKLHPDRLCAFCGKSFAPPTAASTVCSRACSRRVSYARYREQRVAAAVAWGKANREARAAISNQHKAQRRRLEKDTVGSVGVPSKDWIKLVRRYRHCCAYCGRQGQIHMEHVIPVSRGGRHAIGNVLPACSTCNLNKQASFVSEWKLRKARLERLAAARPAA